MLTTVKTRKLKSGALGKAAEFSAGSRSTAAFVTSADMEQLYLLESAVQGKNYRGEYPLPSEGVGRLLQHLLASNRCHWQSLDNPVLTLGTSLQGTVGWHLGDDEKLRIQIIEPVGHFQLLPSAPTWYLDTEKNQLGPLETELDEQAALALTSSPPIPMEQADQVSIELKQLFPSQALPLPAVSLEPVRTDIKPVPVLRLASHQDGSYRRYGMEPFIEHFGVLSFTYDGHSVDPRNHQQQLSWKDHDGHLIRVNRIIEQEKNYLYDLNEFYVYEEENPSPTEGWWLYHVDEEAGWLEFIAKAVPQLENQGWQIEYDDSCRLRISEPDEWYADRSEALSPNSRF